MENSCPSSTSKQFVGTPHFHFKILQHVTWRPCYHDLFSGDVCYFYSQHTPWFLVIIVFKKVYLTSNQYLLPYRYVYLSYYAKCSLFTYPYSKTVFSILLSFTHFYGLLGHLIFTFKKNFHSMYFYSH